MLIRQFLWAISTGLLLDGGEGSKATDCKVIPLEAKVELVGAFSNKRYTPDHVYGHELRLWRSGDCLFGFFQVSEGPPGPLGELRDVVFDRSTGKLSFSSKVSGGLIAFRGSGGFVKSRDLFTFQGQLSKTELIGTVTYVNVNKNNPNAKPIKTKVRLRRTKENDEYLSARTYAEWRKKWEPILRRGDVW